MPKASVGLLDFHAVGTTVTASIVHSPVTVSPGLAFGLAVFPSSATYPAKSTDGGTTWRIAGPEFYFAAAQGANATTTMGALPPDGAYAWGQGGDAVKVTTDGGSSWWVADFPWGVYRVSTTDGDLNVIALGPQQNDGNLEAFGYQSTDGGRTWHLQGQVPDVRQ